MACENGEVEITQLLLEARADPLLCGLKPGNISLHDRVACKRRRLFEDSEDDGCSPNARHMHVRRVQFAVRRYENMIAGPPIFNPAKFGVTSKVFSFLPIIGGCLKSGCASPKVPARLCCQAVTSANQVETECS